ncbi:MAG: von Willebrand factor type A domain-containing protein [Planctomycetota bacterium]
MRDRREDLASGATRPEADGERPIERDVQHEELCAYVLGDADEAMRERVETQLQSDVEYRAELERLERTIGAVRASGVDATEVEVASISMPVARTWPRRAMVGLAAAGVMVAAWEFGGWSSGEATPEQSGASDAGTSQVASTGQSAPRDESVDAGLTANFPESMDSTFDARRREALLAHLNEQVTGMASNWNRITESQLYTALTTVPANPETVIDSVFARGAGGGGGGFYHGPGDVVPPATDSGATVLFADALGNASGVVVLDLNGFGHETLGLEQVRGTDFGLSATQAFDVDAFFRACRPFENESPRDMYFRFWGDNAFVITRTDALATFAADVDTASFVLARRYLRDGHLPVKAQVRTEEFVNYFDPDLPAPTDSDLSVHTEMVRSPFGGSDSRYLLRVGVRAREIPREQRDPLVVTFVVDNSGSMKEDNRIELVRHALRTLTAQLGEGDRIGIVAFNGEARLVLPVTDCSQKSTILDAISQLNAAGSTNAEAGLLLGYELAARALDENKESHHRVVLLSDGVANVGETDQDEILEKVAGHRKNGIHLNTVGVGMDNHNDVFLEQLANGGDGLCDYVDDARSVHRALVERFTGAFQPVAADVKIQVEFDNGRVLRWRQLGYENRVIADEDFRNDAVDAGEVGSGHQVTALFELESVEALTGGQNGADDADGDWATVCVRWLQPRSAGESESPREAQEISASVDASALRASFESATPAFQRAAVVAQFAEVLRRSTHARGDSWEQLVRETSRIVTLPEFFKDPDTAELVTMLEAADRLGLDEDVQWTALAEATNEYRRHHYLRHQLVCMAEDVSEAEIAELAEQNDRLEERIRRLLQGR